MPRAEAEVAIDAPIGLVWRVMLDLDAYPAWNPFIVRIDSPADRPARIGDDLGLHVRFRGGLRVRTRERITRLEPPAATGPRREAALEYEFRGPRSGWCAGAACSRSRSWRPGPRATAPASASPAPSPCWSPRAPCATASNATPPPCAREPRVCEAPPSASPPRPENGLPDSTTGAARASSRSPAHGKRRRAASRRRAKSLRRGHQRRRASAVRCMSFPGSRSRSVARRRALLRPQSIRSKIVEIPIPAPMHCVARP